MGDLLAALSSVGAAVAVYVGIRVDLARLHTRLDFAQKKVDDTHNMVIDVIRKM